jgi:hypothetical protein
MEKDRVSSVTFGRHSEIGFNEGQSRWLDSPHQRQEVRQSFSEWPWSGNIRQGYKKSGHDYKSS